MITMKDGWTYKKLGEVCEKITDGSHNPPKGIVKSNNYMLSSQNIQNDHLDMSLVRYLSDEDFQIENKRTNAGKGDVLLTIVGTIGRTCVLNGSEGNVTFQRSVAILKPSKEIESRFLMYYLLSQNNELNTKAQGAAQKGIYLRQLCDFSFQYPPLTEQQSIVCRLDASFAHIDALKANAEKQLAEARKLFQAELTECMRPKDGWVKNTLKDITTKIGSGATPKGGKKVYINNGISLVRSLNVHNAEFTYKDLAHINLEAAKQLDGVELKRNDVLFNITGASIARCCVLPDDVLPARVNQHVSILRPKKDRVLPIFLCYGLLSSDHQNRLLSIGMAGSTRQAVTKADLEAHVFPIPSIDVQKQIVSNLETVETNVRKMEKVYKQTIAECDTLKQALLREVFE